MSYWNMYNERQFYAVKATSEYKALASQIGESEADKLIKTELNRNSAYGAIMLSGSIATLGAVVLGAVAAAGLPVGAVFTSSTSIYAVNEAVKAGHGGLL